MRSGCKFFDGAQLLLKAAGSQTECSGTTFRRLTSTHNASLANGCHNGNVTVKKNFVANAPSSPPKIWTKSIGGYIDHDSKYPPIWATHGITISSTKLRLGDRTENNEVKLAVGLNFLTNLGQSKAHSLMLGRRW